MIALLHRITLHNNERKTQRAAQRKKQTNGKEQAKAKRHGYGHNKKHDLFGLITFKLTPISSLHAQENRSIYNRQDGIAYQYYTFKYTVVLSVYWLVGRPRRVEKQHAIGSSP